MSEEGLDADIGLLEAVGIQVGIVIGAGLFSVTGVAIGSAGPGVAISYVVAILAVSLSLVPTAVLGSLYPTVGGNYRYPSRLWSPRVAFLAVWGMAVSVLGGGLPLYGLSFGQYLASVEPAGAARFLGPVVSADPRMAGAAVITLFFLFNLVGLEPAARVQQLLLLVLGGSLAVFVVAGAPSVQPANLSPLLPNGVGGALVGSALLYFVCMGANFIVDIGGELREAALTIPRSFLVSIPLILVVYVLTSAVAVGMVGWETLAGEPLSVAANAELSASVAAFFTVGALFAIATTINAVYMIAPKYLLVLAEDDILPAQFAVINDRFGTPHWGLTFIYVVSMAFVLSPLSLQRYSTLMAFGSILLVMPVMVSAISLVRSESERYETAAVRVPPRLLVGISATAVVVNLALLGLLASEEPRAFGVWAGLVACGGLYYAARSWYLTESGTALSERMDEVF